jgi:CheY-like chemotaxis protein
MAKILIVDDDPAFQEFVCALFELEGHEPHAALNGRTALELYQQVDPDVILMDVLMPGMDGYEVAEQLKELGAAGRIVFVSAMAQPQDLERAAREGAETYITKPFDFPRLLEAV